MVRLVRLGQGISSKRYFRDTTGFVVHFMLILYWSQPVAKFDILISGAHGLHRLSGVHSNAVALLFALREDFIRVDGS